MEEVFSGLNSGSRKKIMPCGASYQPYVSIFFELGKHYLKSKTDHTRPLRFESQMIQLV